MSQSQTQSQSQIPPQASSSPEQALRYALQSSSADEVFGEDGQPLAHWRYLLDSLETLGSDALTERYKKAQRILRDDGATYNIYDNKDNTSRTWDLDLVPALIGSAEWSGIESGMLERAELLNALLKDIYGSRDLIRHGVIPPEAIFGHGGYLRACHGISMAGDHELILHAADMMRLPNGELRVLTDRTQAPSGMGYALENRTVMSRVLPSLFRDSHVHRLAAFFQVLRKKLTSLSTTQAMPRVVLLTPGVHNETYFEHAYLANYLGFPLVQSGDLVVRNGFVWMKSLDGLNRVDVIFRRVDDWFCDPVELRGDSQLGVPNLLEVVRAGNVVISNPLGTGILENPILFKYMPEISKAILGRDLRIKSMDTYWCGDAQDMAYIEQNFAQLVIKPIYRGASVTSILVRNLSLAEQAELLLRIKKSPQQYVAQSCVIGSHLPTLVKGELQPRPCIFRTFAVASDSSSYTMMPGGLTRVGTEKDGFLISSQLGAQSKDTWVIASEPERKGVVAKPDDAPNYAEEQLVSLPSRVVENLFWMGRYAERAEASLRILRTAFVLLNGEEPISDVSRKYILQAITEVTSTLPGFVDCVPEMLQNPDEELLQVIIDGNRFGSVRHSLNAMLRSADEAKELLSSDTLRVINDIRDELDLMSVTFKKGLGSAPDEALDPLVTALMALAGLSSESMVRNTGWQFMDIGRRLERGVQTVTIMRQLLTNVLTETEENTLMEALLLSLEGLISYRRRYRARLGVQQVLDLVMLDIRNPRSLLFQFEQLKIQLSSLPKAKTSSNELTMEERCVLEGETTIKLSILADLCQEVGDTRLELDNRLGKLKLLLGTLSNTVSDKYFDHRMGPQQLIRSHKEASLS